MGLVYRVAHEKYAESLSVSGMAGRWNSHGKLVLYAAESVSLALLENVVYRAGTGFNQDYRIMMIQIPGVCSTLEKQYLPKNWRSLAAYGQLQKIGNQWYDSRKSLCLRVPSAVSPEDFNVVLNTTHPDFSGVKLIATLPYEPDERLEKILKNYKK